MRTRTWLSLLLALVAPFAFASPPAAAAAPADVPDLDAYVQQVMHDWRVPGLSIAVVKDGKVLLARGYGVRRLGEPGKVDADTLFDIGSNTKAFTVAATTMSSISRPAVSSPRSPAGAGTTTSPHTCSGRSTWTGR